jgi:hypothetical protein
MKGCGQQKTLEPVASIFDSLRRRRFSHNSDLPIHPQLEGEKWSVNTDCHNPKTGRSSSNQKSASN